jgi:hypothetical protein
MTTDTDKLLATVREALLGRRHLLGVAGGRQADEGIAALDAIASELERRKLSICAYCGVAFEWNGEGDSCPGCNRALAAEAELERVRAERDALQTKLRIENEHYGDPEALAGTAFHLRLERDKALALLREITGRDVNGLWSDQDLVDRIRAAIAEIEGNENS